MTNAAFHTIMGIRIYRKIAEDMKILHERMPMLLVAPHTQKSDKLLPVVLITAGMNHEQEPAPRPRGAEFHHIFYVEKGRGVLETEKGRFELEEGTAIFMRRGVPMNYYASGEVFETAWITFVGNGVDAMLECFSAEDFEFLKSETVYSKIVNVCRMVERGKGADMLSKYVYDIIVTFFCQLDSAKKPELLLRAKEYIEKNYASAISAFDIAASLGISESMLFKLFRENEDGTPNEFLRSVRIYRAEQLLLSNTKMKIADVARECGFSDSAYFCKVFREEIGMTPRNYQIKYMQ